MQTQSTTRAAANTSTVDYSISQRQAQQRQSDAQIILKRLSDKREQDMDNYFRTSAAQRVQNTTC